MALFLEAARATADFYLANSCADGIPMWDTGAPNLHRLGDYLDEARRPVQPLGAGGQLGRRYRGAGPGPARELSFGQRR